MGAAAPSVFGRMVASSRFFVLLATVSLFLARLFSGSPGSCSSGSSRR